MTGTTTTGTPGADYELWATWLEAMAELTGARGSECLYLSVLYHCHLVGES